MSHYTANLRDIEFCLFDLLGRDKVMGTNPYGEVDRETAIGMLEEVKRLCENDLAASFVEGDRVGAILNKETGNVTLPESFKKSYKAYVDGEWWRVDAPVDLGGMKIPPSVRWAIAEMVLGSNPAIHIYASGYAFAQVAYVLGTDEQKKIAKQMVEKHWGATMQLTEPDAGSDVGAGRTKAVQQADGTWHITGTKRYITSGDADFYDNVIHFVLARREGGGPGTKGLSLFLIPKFMFDFETGEMGKRNGVYVTQLEDKMGLNVSATCEVNLGEKEPAVGYLLGEVHDCTKVPSGKVALVSGFGRIVFVSTPSCWMRRSLFRFCGNNDACQRVGVQRTSQSSHDSSEVAFFIRTSSRLSRFIRNSGSKPISAPRGR